MREVNRQCAHSDLVQDQITAEEAERDRMILHGRQAVGVAAGPDDSVERKAARIALLTAFKEIGANDATLLINEVFLPRLPQPEGTCESGRPHTDTDTLGVRCGGT